jgi:hypothetical protein
MKYISKLVAEIAQKPTRVYESSCLQRSRIHQARRTRSSHCAVTTQAEFYKRLYLEIVLQ